MNMAGRWRNGSGNRRGNGSSGRDTEHDEIRRECENCGTRIDGLEKFSDELRLGQVQREEQIRGLRHDLGTMTGQVELHVTEYRADKVSSALDIANLRGALDAFKVQTAQEIATVRADTTLALTNAKTELGIALESGLRRLDKKFDDNKTYFTRYFIIILVTMLTGLVVGGAAFVMNR
jgi:hypothetical protein